MATPPDWTDQLPYTIHYLDGRTRQVPAHAQPDSYLTAWQCGPGQHVYETGGMPTPPAGHGQGH